MHIYSGSRFKEEEEEEEHAGSGRVVLFEGFSLPI